MRNATDEASRESIERTTPEEIPEVKVESKLQQMEKTAESLNVTASESGNSATEAVT